MATQGTNDSGSSMNRGKSFNGPKKSDYQGKKPSTGGPRTPRSEYKGENRGERSDRGEYRGDKPRYSSSTGSDKGRFNKSEGGQNHYNKDRFDKNKNYNSVPRFPNKDEDDEDNSRRSKPSRPKESKPGVAIPDKNKVQLRLEKEQKSMKKKQQSKKKESTRPQPKVKRSNNVNYIKNYANGDYDEYDEYEDYYDM